MSWARRRSKAHLRQLPGAASILDTVKADLGQRQGRLRGRGRAVQAPRRDPEAAALMALFLAKTSLQQNLPEPAKPARGWPSSRALWALALRK